MIGVRDTAVAVLNYRLGEDPPPGEMHECNAAQLAAIHVYRGVGRGAGYLVGDGEDRVEAVLAGHVEVAIDLLVLKLRAAGLDFDEAMPLRLAALDDDGTVRDVRLAGHVLELDLGVG